MGRYENADGLFDHIDHFVEFAEQRLSVEGLSLPERYIELSTFHFLLGRGISAVADGLILGIGLSWTHKNAPIAGIRGAGCVFSDKLANYFRIEERNVTREKQQSMLISCVELMDTH